MGFPRWVLIGRKIKPFMRWALLNEGLLLLAAADHPARFKSAGGEGFAPPGSLSPRALRPPSITLHMTLEYHKLQG